jgi:hypothetical protein
MISYREEIAKLAQSIFAPFTVEDKTEFHSPKGYAKEQANRNIGSAIGGISGGVLGAAAGKLVAKAKGAHPETLAKLLKLNPAIAPMVSGLLKKKVDIKTIVGILSGLGVGAAVGNIAGDYKSIKDTEAEAGVPKTNIEDFVLRRLQGGRLADKSSISDYLLTRTNGMQNKEGEEMETNELLMKYIIEKSYNDELDKIAKANTSIKADEKANRGVK